jgi:hypothetical protein
VVPWETLARGPVGIPLLGSEADASVGEGLATEGVEGAPPQPISGRRSENEPRRAPRPRGEGLYPRGPDGGASEAAVSDRVREVVFGGGDFRGAEKFLLALGPVGGALNPDGPRGGDRGLCGDRIGSGARAGDLSIGVDFVDSLSRIGSGDLSRFIGDLPLE